MKTLFYLFSLLLLFSACGGSGKKQIPNRKTPPKQQVAIPDFNSDSAYLYIEQQVAFGPRVPNTTEHASCAQFLIINLSFMLTQQ